MKGAGVMTKIPLWVLSLALVQPLRAGGSGTSAAGFLKEGAGARASAMGEAASAAVSGATALYWNPAALVVSEKKSVTLMRSMGAESSAYSYGSYAQKIGAGWGFGLGVQHQSFGSLDTRDASGFPAGGLSPTDTAFSVGAARNLGPASWGAALKVVRSQVVDSASTMALDLGLLTPATLKGRLELAFTASHLGGGLKYGSVSEPLPMTLRAGSLLKLNTRWSAALDVVSPKGGDAFGALGTEYRLSTGGGVAWALRAGYSTASSDVEGATGLSAGAGMAMNGMRLEYGFVPYGDLGSTHRMSLSYDF